MIRQKGPQCTVYFVLIKHWIHEQSFFYCHCIYLLFEKAVLTVNHTDTGRNLEYEPLRNYNIMVV